MGRAAKSIAFILHASRRWLNSEEIWRKRMPCLTSTSLEQGMTLHIWYTSSSMLFLVHRDALTIQFLIPHELLAKLPNKEIRQGALIKVVPVLFTQGVNEKQTLANIKNE